MFYYIVKFILFIFFKIINRTVVINLNKDDNNKSNFILVANQPSIMVYGIIISVTKNRIYFVTKKENHAILFKRLFFKLIDTIFLNRDKADISAIRQSIQLLNKNKILCIFPEGIMSKTLLPFKEGAAYLSLKTGVFILPYYVKIQRRGIFFKSVVVIGERLPVLDEDGTALDQKQKRQKLNKLLTLQMNKLENYCIKYFQEHN